MKDAEFYRGSFIEKINKTIAMITASKEYQTYIKRRRQYLWQKSLGDSARHYGKRGGKLWEDKECAACGESMYRNKFLKNFCRPCGRRKLVNAYRNGSGINELAHEFGIHPNTITRALRDLSRGTIRFDFNAQIMPGPSLASVAGANE